MVGMLSTAWFLPAIADGHRTTIGAARIDFKCCATGPLLTPELRSNLGRLLAPLTRFRDRNRLECDGSFEDKAGHPGDGREGAG
jgi:hypothetical protein